jgi:outer membrane protein
MKNKIFILALIIICPFYVKAQKHWTLEECIQYALMNNLQIKRQELQTGISKNNLNQSYIDLLPDLNAGGTHNISSGYNTNYTNVKTSDVKSYGNFGITSNLVVFNGLQKMNTIKLYKYNFLVTQENLKIAQNDIAINIASAYLQVLSSKELLEVAQNQLEVTKLQVERTQKLVDIGNLAKGSLLEIQAQAASEEATVIDSKNKLDMSYLGLAQLLDLDTLKNFEIFIPLELNVPEAFFTNADSIFSIAVNTMPEIKSAEYSLMSSKTKLPIAQGARFPQLSLSAGYGSLYDLKLPNYALRNQINDFASKQVSFTLSVPIFTKFQIQKNVSNAKIGVLDSEYALKQTKNTLRKEIEQAHADALASLQNYRSRTQSAAAYEENLKYIQQKYDVGIVNSVDYNIAKNNYSKAASDLLQAKYEFIFKTKILDFYMGRPIKL